MRSQLIGLGLFASAFSPVLVALALVTTPFGSAPLDGALVAVCAAPALLVVLSLRSVSRLQENRIRFVKVRRSDRDVLAFMASFVLPIATAFFAVDAARWAATGVLLALLVVVYVRAQLFQLNPVLAAAGFHLFEVETERGVEITVLSRRRRLPEGSVLARRFSDELYIDLGRQ